MTQRDFERGMLLDVGVAALGVSAMVGLGLVAPDWVVGVACLLLVPAFVVGVFVHAWWVSSHRRDTDQPGADHAHDSEPVLAPTASGPAETSPSQPVRSPLVSAWVDFAWACHWAALHSYRSTRPGR